MSYNPQMQNRDVPPQGYDQTGLFNQPDSTIRGKQSKMVATRLLSGTNNEWAYCSVHRQILYWDGSKWRDCENSVHDATGGNLSYPYPPHQKCVITRLPEQAVLASDDSVGKVAEMILKLRESMRQAGMVEDGGTSQEVSEDYKKTVSATPIQEGTRHIEILETGPRPIVRLNPEGFDDYARCRGCHHIASECTCFDRID